MSASAVQAARFSGMWVASAEDWIVSDAYCATTGVSTGSAGSTGSGVSSGSSASSAAGSVCGAGNDSSSASKRTVGLGAGTFGADAESAVVDVEAPDAAGAGSAFAETPDRTSQTQSDAASIRAKNGSRFRVHFISIASFF